ncbi:uncharacterized protein LOC129749510 [Uranotaenia lowii]|uniref:uncharacterized protein LOC129749510 n=1 Tax=Uranotaenia lowii TaxID=190385 RepID=UPI002478FA98|nr:uncharacterized protein LOC129749510 [Uranotaenia lowii]
MEATAMSSSNLLIHAISDDSELDGYQGHVIIDEITEAEPTSVILRYCKGKFLRPYICILGFAGMRPSAIDAGIFTLLGHLQSFLVLLLLLIGYVLQYWLGFRRDRGFLGTGQAPNNNNNNITSSRGTFIEDGTFAGVREVGATTSMPPPESVDPAILKLLMINTGEMIFIYTVPALMHLGGYVMAVYIYRFADNEQLQCLIERVFILCRTPRRLVAILWVYFGFGVVWLACSISYIAVIAFGSHELPPHDNDGGIFQWSWELNPTVQNCLRILLCVALSFHDLVQMVVIISYSLMCYLLRCYLRALKEKLILHTIEPLNWMREICEFRKLLHHLNTKISLPVACLALLNVSYTISSIAHLFRDLDACPIRIFSRTIANVLLWLVISLTPFFQAASLTVTCRQTQTSGHLISIRPFVHRDTSSEELNTVLLYASSLRMSAKLFRMPVTAHYLCFFIFCCTIGLLTFGMCLTLAVKPV